MEQFGRDEGRISRRAFHALSFRSRILPPAKLLTFISPQSSWKAAFLPPYFCSKNRGIKERLVFESDRLDMPPGTQPGAFTELVNHLYSLLAERVLTSQTLRDQLDSIQAQREASVDCWVELLQDVETLKTMHKQP